MTIGEKCPRCETVSETFWGMDHEQFCVFFCEQCRQPFRQAKSSDDGNTPLQMAAEPDPGEGQPMTGMQAETTDYPKPTFSHRAYGVQVEWFGEDGGMVALGHIPDLRFVAACNNHARKVAGIRNIWDDPAATLEDVLAEVVRIWAVPADPSRYDDWAVTWHGITEQTPGAIALTVLDP